MTIRLVFSVLLIASTVALGACAGSDSGGSSGDISDLSADKVVAAARKQLAAEEFVSVKGEGKDEKDGTDLAFDLGFAGDTAAGTVTTNGVELKLLKVDGQTYFKADRGFFGSSGSSAETMDLIGGRWVLVDADDPKFGGLVSFVSKREFSEQLLSPEGKVSKVDDKTVDGVDCVGLKSTKSTLYLDKRDGRPVSLVTTDDGSGTLSFTYDRVDEAKTPPADEVVDLSKVGS